MRISRIPLIGPTPGLMLLLIGSLAPIAVVACTPEAQESTESNLEEAGRDLEQLGREFGDRLEEAGEALERGVDRAGRQIEPYARDAEITARIKLKLAADPEVNPFRIDVDTVDGRVTLGGTVRTEHQREEAGRLARNTEGVVEVRNLLEVGPRGR